MKAENEFIRITVPSIAARTFTFPFPFDSQIQINLALPIESFNPIYNAFDDELGIELTVCDIQCTFDCKIISFQQQKTDDDTRICDLTLSNVSRVLYDVAITEELAIAGLIPAIDD